MPYFCNCRNDYRRNIRSSTMKTIDLTTGRKAELAKKALRDAGIDYFLYCNMSDEPENQTPNQPSQQFITLAVLDLNYNKALHTLEDVCIYVDDRWFEMAE